MSFDPQAQQLNDAITATHPQVLDMLSARGKAIYFPKLGVLAQSAEAQGKDINATIGIDARIEGVHGRAIVAARCSRHRPGFLAVADGE